MAELHKDMEIRRIGEWFNLICIWCGHSGGGLRAITSIDHPSDQPEALGIGRCSECGQDTRFVKMIGQPPVFIPGKPEDWIREKD